MYEDRRLASITTIKTSAVKVEVESPLALLAVFIFALCSPFYVVFMLSRASPISLQDGQYNTMCLPARHIDAYMYQHYDHGFILSDQAGGGDEFEAGSAGIDFKNVIYQGSDYPSPLWNKALAHPEQHVQWVVLNPYDPRDLVAQHINVRTTTFNVNFELVAMQDGGPMLFHLRGLPPLPNRAPMPRYAYPHYPCQ